MEAAALKKKVFAIVSNRTETAIIANDYSLLRKAECVC